MTMKCEEKARDSTVCDNRTLPDFSSVPMGAAPWLNLNYLSGILALIDGLGMMDWFISFLFEQEETESQPAQTDINSVFSVPLCFHPFLAHDHSEIRSRQRQLVNGNRIYWVFIPSPSVPQQLFLLREGLVKCCLRGFCGFARFCILA